MSLELTLQFSDKEIHILFVLFKMNIVSVSIKSFIMMIRKKFKQQEEIKIFFVNIINIKKTLRVKLKTDLWLKLLAHYFKFLNVFDQAEVSKLSFIQSSNKNHKIKLVLNEKNQTLNSFWNSLYSMSHDELLILKKTLINLLNKRFI